MIGPLYHPTPLEVAWGWVPGHDGVPLAVTRHVSPRAALEEVLLEALARPPCYVTFSGGRDSSALLAMAAGVARREGTPLPVPITQRFENAPSTDEAAWQDEVVRSLRLTDWVRQSFADELDLVGPISAQVLRRHGLLWPPRLFADIPIVEQARGGTVITGEGGDELLGGTRVTPAVRVVKGMTEMSRDALTIAAEAIAPRPLRHAFRKSSRHEGPSWLREGSGDAYHRAITEDELSEPVRWNRAVRRLPCRRSVRAGLLTNLRALAAEGDVRFVHPFLEPAFVDAVAGAGGAWGFASRSEAMVALFGDVLPPALLTRSSKATFTAPAINTHSRAFIEGWDGNGVDPHLVDPDRLLSAWRQPEPDARSFLLLQQAWLATATP